MKIANKILILFSSIILVVCLAGLILQSYVAEHYVHYKYEDAYSYYYKQQPTIDEFSEYLINEGFIVTTTKVPTYETESNITCHVKENELVIYSGNTPALYAILNENIVNDISQLLLYSVVTINIIVILILIIVYLYFNKNIINKLDRLQREMVNFKTIDIDHIPNTESNNELNKLITEFYQMANTIKSDEKQKQFLIMTISHELKNPLSNIEAITDMHAMGVAPYNDALQMKKLIDAECTTMKELVNSLLTAYKCQVDQTKSEVNIKNLIEELLQRQLVKTNAYSITIEGKQECNWFVNEQGMESIINNIVSNIVKYSNQDVIDIKISTEQIMFVNKVKSTDDNMQSTRVGNLINEYLATEIGLRITNTIDNEHFTTIINNNKD